MWPISTRVNKPENDDPSIVEPITLDGWMRLEQQLDGHRLSQTGEVAQTHIWKRLHNRNVLALRRLLVSISRENDCVLSPIDGNVAKCLTIIEF